MKYEMFKKNREVQFFFLNILHECFTKVPSIHFVHLFSVRIVHFEGKLKLLQSIIISINKY